MKGNQRVIEQLQHLLAGELAARDQYFIHSRLYHAWGRPIPLQRSTHGW